MPLDEIQLLREKRGQVSAEINELLEGVEREKRDLSHGERKKFDRLEERSAVLASHIADLERKTDRSGMTLSRDGVVPDLGFTGVGGASATRSGRALTLRPEQRMSDWFGGASSTFSSEEASEFSLGRAVRGWSPATGRTQTSNAEHLPRVPARPVASSCRPR